MSEIERAAYIIAQAACAQIEAMAMQAHNEQDIRVGRQPLYHFGDFMELQNKYGIHHNAVLGERG